MKESDENQENERDLNFENESLTCIIIEIEKFSLNRVNVQNIARGISI